MNRRDYLRITSMASALAVSGGLPLLGAERAARRAGAARAVASPVATMDRNIFTEPPAIEPITGYLDSFEPYRMAVSMRDADFSARFDLVRWMSVGGKFDKSRNLVAGSLEVERSVKIPGGGASYTVREIRDGQTIAESIARVACPERLIDEAASWEITSNVKDGKSGASIADLSFTEKGAPAPGAKRPTIAQWSLLRVLAQGTLKKSELRFDMLDAGMTLKPDQTLRFAGEVEIPVAGGANVPLDCYLQTGRGVLPIHYLVDVEGRTQLITQSDVNWALKEMGVVIT